MYRKFTADHLFNGHQLLAPGQVLITDITGTVVEIVAVESAGDDVLYLSGMLCPGFVNTHCHLELSHLKGIIPEKTGLVEFVQQVMIKRQSSQRPPERDGIPEQALVKQAAIIAAEKELYDSGTVAIGDICNTIDTIAVKDRSGMRYHNFIEVSGFTDAAFASRLEQLQAVFNSFQSRAAKQGATLSPHASYSVSKLLFTALNALTPNQLITIHNQESRQEDKLYKNKAGEFLGLYRNFNIDISAFQPTGKSSMQSWLPYINKGQTILAVHNTFTGEEDLDFADQQVPGSIEQIFYCICINANQFIEGAVPPLQLLRERNAVITIGTDSYASNRCLNMLEEIKSIQAATNYDIPLSEILQWATLNGSKALKMEGELGSFDKGKQPGIVLIEHLRDLNTTPLSSVRRLS